MNDNFQEEEIKDYLALMNAGDEEALLASNAAQQMMKDESFAPSPDAVQGSIEQDNADQLVDHFGELGQAIVDLNRQLVSGQITTAQMKRTVLTDPALLQAAMQAKALNLITY